MLPILVFWILPIIIATRVGSGKGRGGEGFAWGLFLGWFGVLIIAMRRPSIQIQTVQMAVLAATASAAAVQAAQARHPSRQLPPPNPANRRSA